MEGNGPAAATLADDRFPAGERPRLSVSCHSADVSCLLSPANAFQVAMRPRISIHTPPMAIRAGKLTTRADTNNQAYTAARREMPEEEEYPYQHIACDVAIQTVRPKTLEVVMNLEQGRHEGNRECICSVSRTTARGL